VRKRTALQREWKPVQVLRRFASGRVVEKVNPMEETMESNFIIAGIAGALIAIPATAFAQGQGGYAAGTPGASTAAVSSTTVKHLRKHHMTNDTSGGSSSVDKSGMTQENGGAVVGAHGSDQAMGAHAPGNTGGTATSPSGH
jgi:hypothetical protein